MNRPLTETALAVAALLIPSTGTASVASPRPVASTTIDGAGSDFNGAAEIARGDMVAAERLISARLAATPGGTDLLFNLAFVYRHTGRPSEARALYRTVLTQPDEMVVTEGRGTHRAHLLAQAALARMDGTQLTAR